MLTSQRSECKILKCNNSNKSKVSETWEMNSNSNTNKYTWETKDESDMVDE